MFDSIKHIETQIQFDYLSEQYCYEDIDKALAFLKAYAGSQGTFNSYRREVERLIHWSALIANKKLSELNRADVEDYFKFCQNPGLENQSPRVLLKKKVNEYQVQIGVHLQPLSQKQREENYLLQEEYAQVNPVALIRQKNQFIRKKQGQPKIRRLSELQWQYVISTAKNLCPSGDRV